MKKNVLVIGKNMSLNEMLSRQYVTIMLERLHLCGLRELRKWF